MNKIILSILALFITSVACGQIQFEEGYYITQSGEKVLGLIENKDWNDNPENFNFKQNENSEIVSLSVVNVSEFGLLNLRFLKADVEIDLSRDQVRELTSQRAPNFIKKTVFLKYLQDGVADLFFYRENSVFRYFFRLNEESPKQLVYKKFLQGDKIAVNNHYQQQLFTNLNCGNMTISEVEGISYTQTDLEKYFRNYNTCVNSSISNYNKNTSKGKLSLKLLIGSDFTKLDVERGLNADGVQFENEISLRAGLEIEYLLPFNGNKWSAFLQPAYSSFKGEKHLEKMYEADLLVDYTSVEIALGIRHYIFLNNAAKLFLNASVSKDLSIKSEVSFLNTNRAQDPFINDLKSGSSFGIGGGVNLKDKLGLELRYNTSREIYGEKEVINNYYLDWRSKISTFSVIVTYKLL